MSEQIITLRTTQREHIANLLIHYCLHGDGSELRAYVGIDATRVEALRSLIDDRDFIDELPDIEPERYADFYALVFELLGGHRDNPHKKDELVVRANNRDHEFGQLFAHLVQHLPTEGDPAANWADSVLAPRLGRLPEVDRERQDRLKKTASVRGCDAQEPALARMLVRHGLTPLAFLNAGFALGRLLSRAVRAGELPAGFEVELSKAGRLSGDWNGDPEAALEAAATLTETSKPHAEVLFGLLCAGTERLPHIIHRHHARFDKHRRCLITALSQEDIDEGLSDPLSAWHPRHYTPSSEGD